MTSHPDLQDFQRIFAHVRELQALASRHGIDDIFQDNGAKLLQIMLLLNMHVIPGREGKDAKDVEGREYEMKSVNVALQDAVTTHHHMTLELIEGYRPVEWIIAAYHNIELRKVYIMSPKGMKPWYRKWTEQLKDPNRKHINNPKIPLWYVTSYGQVLYDAASDPPLRFDTLALARAARVDDNLDQPDMFPEEEDAELHLIHLTKKPRPPPKPRAPRKRK